MSLNKTWRRCDTGVTFRDVNGDTGNETYLLNNYFTQLIYSQSWAYTGVGWLNIFLGVNNAKNAKYQNELPDIDGEPDYYFPNGI